MSTELHRPTPGDALGPMYFVNKPVNRGLDLTVNPANHQSADGQVIFLNGTVLDATGAPIPGSSVEFWQPNAAGRYRHVMDTNPAPLDPNFDGWADLKTNLNGAWYAKTIKPGGYPADTARGWMRPPHIHFLVKTPYCWLCTQMYFPGEPDNEGDDFYKLAAEQGNVDLLIAKPWMPGEAEEGRLYYAFNIYVPLPVTLV